MNARAGLIFNVALPLMKDIEIAQRQSRQYGADDDIAGQEVSVIFRKPAGDFGVIEIPEPINGL